MFIEEPYANIVLLIGVVCLLTSTAILTYVGVVSLKNGLTRAWPKIRPPEYLDLDDIHDWDVSIALGVVCLSGVLAAGLFCGGRTVFFSGGRQILFFYALSVMSFLPIWTYTAILRWPIRKLFQLISRGCHWPAPVKSSQKMEPGIFWVYRGEES